MPKLPRACGDKHVSAFKAAGWQVNHIEGSHYILTKENSEIHLSIPVHKNQIAGDHPNLKDGVWFGRPPRTLGT